MKEINKIFETVVAVYIHTCDSISKDEKIVSIKHTMLKQNIDFCLYFAFLFSVTLYALENG